MKYIALAILGLSLMAVAQQPQQVPVTEAEKKDIDLYQTKLLNVQLEANALQAQMTNLADEFKVDKELLKNALDKARKAHGLDDTAVWDEKGFQFSVTPKTEKK